MGIKERYKEYMEQRKDRAEFQKEVDKETLEIRRKAYREESIKQASTQGQKLAYEKANKPSFGERVSQVARNINVNSESAMPRRAPVRRRVVRRRAIRRAPIIRAPVKRRRTKRKPVRRRTTKQRVPVIKAPVKRRKIKRKFVKRSEPSRNEGYSMTPTENWSF